MVIGLILLMVGGGNTVETNSANEFSLLEPTSLAVVISSENKNILKINYLIQAKG